MISLTTNIAELKTRKGVAKATVKTLGYYTASDGGGNTFQWDSTSTAADNGGSIIAVTGVATGRWVATGVSVNIRQFGAKGDGTTNDTSAVAAAIATGKSVFIPIGTYILTANLVLNSNQQLYGEGTGSVLKAGADGLRDLVGINGKTNVSVSNFKIDGGGQTTNVFTGFKYCFGVTVYNSSNITIENLTIDKCGIARTGSNATIQDDNLWGGMGIIVGARSGIVKNVVIRNCRISNIASGGNIVGDGIYIEGYNSDLSIVPENIVVEDCYVENVGRNCYSLAGEGGNSLCYNTTIRNCTGRNSALAGIDFEEGVYCKVLGAEFQNCGTYAAYYNPTTVYGADYRLRAGVVMGNYSTYNIVKDIRIRDSYYGLNWGAGTDNTYENITITNSTILDGARGLASLGSNNTFRGCKFLTTGQTMDSFYNGTSHSNLIVENCTFASILILVHQQNSTFRGNQFKKKVVFGFENKNILFESNTFLDTTGASFENLNTFAEDITFKSCRFIGNGANYLYGIYTVYQSVLRLNVIGCTFKNYLGNATDGCGIYHLNNANQNSFGTVSGNTFVNCDHGIRWFQGGWMSNVISNNFSNISKWCIYIEALSSVSPLQLKSCVFENNIADATCANGLWIDNQTGSWDYCSIRGNKFNNVTAVDYNLSVVDNNLNGTTEAPVLVRPVITKTANFTLGAGEIGKHIRVNNASDITVLIPQDSAFYSRPGTRTIFEQVGVGKIIFNDEINGTVLSKGNGYRTDGPRAIAYLDKVSYDDSTLSGDIMV